MFPAPVSLFIDCANSLGPLQRLWTSIGYDEINWTYSPRGKVLYQKLKELDDGPYYVRNHNTFTSGNGLSSPAWGSTNVVHIQPDGSLLFDWTILDQVYDTIVGAGFKPLIELGFMPRDFARIPENGPAGGSNWFTDVGREGYESDGLWKCPPKDFALWAELVRQFAQHLVARYGQTEVNTWLFEVWNEPNLPNYWRGSFEEYCVLYDTAEEALHSVLPQARLGGPATASPGLDVARRFLTGFLAHCVAGQHAVTGKTGVRLDFVSFHSKGAMFTRRRIYNQSLPVEKECPLSAVMLNDVRAGLAAVEQFAELAHVPVLVDECDPALGTIYGVYDNPNFAITNSAYYPAFLCALVKRLLDLDTPPQRLERITTWAFYFEGKRFFEGNRALMDNANLDKPVLNGLRMLARLGDTRLRLESSASRDVLDGFVMPQNILEGGARPQFPVSCFTPEVDGLATQSGQRVAVLIWHQADPWWYEGQAEVQVKIAGLPFEGPARLTHYRLDGEHSNSYAEWQRQGAPQDPSPAVLAQIAAHQGLELLEPPRRLAMGPARELNLAFSLPVYGLSLLVLEPEPEG